MESERLVVTVLSAFSLWLKNELEILNMVSDDGALWVSSEITISIEQGKSRIHFRHSGS